MGIEDLIQAQPGGESLSRSRLDHPMEFWGPPLAPAHSRGSDDIPREEEDAGAENRDARPLQPVKKNYFAAIATSLQQPHQLLITSAVILAGLGIAALASIWSSAGEKVAAQSSQSGPAVRPPLRPKLPMSGRPQPTETPRCAKLIRPRRRRTSFSCNGPACTSGLRPRRPDACLRPPPKARASRLPTGKAIGCRWRAIGSAVGSDRDFLRRMSRNISYGFMAGPFGRFACHERSREELPRR